LDGCFQDPSFSWQMNVTTEFISQMAIALHKILFISFFILLSINLIQLIANHDPVLAIVVKIVWLLGGIPGYLASQKYFFGGQNKILDSERSDTIFVLFVLTFFLVLMGWGIWTSWPDPFFISLSEEPNLQIGLLVYGLCFFLNCIVYVAKGQTQWLIQMQRIGLIPMTIMQFIFFALFSDRFR
jgi:hypothetical protein